jgi:hypothetical protein
MHFDGPSNPKFAQRTMTIKRHGDRFLARSRTASGVIPVHVLQNVICQPGSTPDRASASLR